MPLYNRDSLPNGVTIPTLSAEEKTFSDDEINKHRRQVSEEVTLLTPAEVANLASGTQLPGLDKLLADAALEKATEQGMSARAITTSFSSNRMSVVGVVRRPETDEEVRARLEARAQQRLDARFDAYLKMRSEFG